MTEPRTEAEETGGAVRRVRRADAAAAPVAALLLNRVSPARLLATAAHRWWGGVVTGGAGAFVGAGLRWWMKIGPMSASRSPKGIITSHGTMAACAQRFDTPARYTIEARASSGGWSVTSGEAACATLQSPGMAGTPKPPKKARRPAKDDEVISPGGGVAWRRVWWSGRERQGPSWKTRLPTWQWRSCAGCAATMHAA